jgi:thiamine-phosphate diphosphorylase
MFDAASRLAQASQGSGSLLVVNDRVDVALAAGADGVHLGERSLSPDDVRGMAPDGFLIGASVHAADGELPAADWLMAGNVFATPSHPGRPPAGVELVSRLVRRGARVVAVGGVTPDRLGVLRQAGAAGVAVISGVWDAPDPADRARRYLEGWYA